MRGGFDTFIVDCEQFGPISVSVGEQVFLYRRIQDAYDKSLIAVINQMSEPIGYLERDVAAERVLPALREGVRFRCVVAGEPVERKVPVQIQPVTQSEVAGILSRQGVRRERGAGFPPLAGIFDGKEAGVEFEAEEMGEAESEFEGALERVPDYEGMDE